MAYREPSTLVRKPEIKPLAAFICGRFEVCKIHESVRALMRIGWRLTVCLLLLGHSVPFLVSSSICRPVEPVYAWASVLVVSERLIDLRRECLTKGSQY